MGAILSVIGATLGSVAVFLAARTAFYDLFHARAGAALARFEDGFRRDSFSYLLFLRLVPVFPFWLVNIVPALLGMRLGPYILATLIGIIPAAFVMPASARASARCSTAARRRTSASSRMALPAALLGLAALALVRCSTRICAAARRRRDMTAVLTPDVCVVGGGSAAWSSLGAASSAWTSC